MPDAPVNWFSGLRKRSLCLSATCLTSPSTPQPIEVAMEDIFNEKLP